MSTGAVIAVVVAAIVVGAVVAALVMRRGGAVGVKRRFGPEYERALARNDGDVKATRRELSERVRRFGGLERKPLSAGDRERYTTSWAAVQARFVDEPGAAVNEADRLLAGLAAERGFPGAESPDHFNALSVHHPHEVQGYRHAHTLAEHGPVGRQATEELRQALLGARSMFEALVADGRQGAAPPPPPAPTGGGAAQVPPSLDKPAGSGTGSADPADGEEPVGSTRRGPLAHRFAAFAGGGRRGDQNADGNAGGV